MSKLDIFTTSTYRLLSYLYDKKLPDNYIYFTQDEVAKDMGLSRATINRLINDLRENNYLDLYGPHFGRYKMTELGIKVVETFRKIENI